MIVIIISGLSGAGKSTALRALEDEGFYCIDHLPIEIFAYMADYILKKESEFQR